MAAKKPTKKSTRQSQFYEAMPGALYDHPFYAAPYVADEQWQQDMDDFALSSELTVEQARGRMVWYGLGLIALFGIQIILFVLLLRSTVNLG